MISEQSALQHISSNSASQDWSVTPPHKAISVVAALFASAARGIMHFIQIPALPSAALWEASTLVRILASTEKTEYRPDLFSTESPFLSDRWPRDL
jgi:hypothetical protein